MPADRYRSIWARVAATPVPAFDYTDLWWNAGESGWGLNLMQHASNVIFGVMYTYDTNGTISADTITTLTTAATAMASTATDAHLGVYARPTGPGATDGMWSPVTSFSIPDLAVVLRSRRD